MVERSSPNHSLQKIRQICISVWTFLCAQCLQLWQGASLLQYCLPCELSTACWQDHFWRPKKRHQVLGCVLQELKSRKECGLFSRHVVWMHAGVFSPSCFKRNVYFPTSSASLKTGRIAVLTMRDFSINENSSASAIPSGCHELVPSSSSSLWVSQPFYTVMLNKGRDI